MTMTSGSTTLFDNNGNGYPISDAVILQTPQSCLLQGSGALTVSAIVSNLPPNCWGSAEDNTTDQPRRSVTTLSPRTP